MSHPAAPMLLEYAHVGCPAETGEQWTLDLLENAVQHGAHPSAQDPIAAQALLTETLKKVKEGFATIVPWRLLKEHLPATLKISPIAAIPHKSRMFRMILDLSYGHKMDGLEHPSCLLYTSDAADE